MFIVTPQSEIAYAGAIDSIRSAKVADIEKAENYVAAALDSLVPSLSYVLKSQKTPPFRQRF